MKSTVKLYQLDLNTTKTYLFALLFIVGNLLLPQLLHIVPGAGLRWLPIYFFTLIGAYKYGWRVGLLTALLSPLLNSWLFGMPPVSALPSIELKSILLAVAAGFAAARFGKVSIPLLLAVVLTYQVMGGAGEWLIKGSIGAALQDFRMGTPGMALQIIGGYLIIRYILQK